jgi:hypothetical protein
MTIRNDTRLEDLLARVKELGKAEGKGLNAKPTYALDVVAMAHEGVIGNDHAETLWKAFAEASAKTKGDEKARLANPKVDKVRISETRKLIAVGACAAFDPNEMMSRAVAVIAAHPVARGSTYQNLIKVSREQLDRRAQALNDDEISAAITPNAPEVKAEKEQLDALIKKMKKLHDGDEKDPGFTSYPSPELQAAIKSLEQRVATLVSTEEMDKLFAMAAKKGFTVAPALTEVPAEEVQAAA